MSDLNLASIQADLKLSLKKVAKIHEIFQIEIEKVSLKKKVLRIYQMRKDLTILRKNKKKRINKHINNDNVI